MDIDPKLVAECEEARSSMRDAEEALRLAQSNFERSVRRLYVEGASTRQIAAALGLSHQRVHQLVGAEPKSWWRRTLGLSPEPPRECSFCGKSAKEVSKLVAGPGIYICDSCIHAAAGLFATATDEGAPPFERLPVTSQKRCSFCGKRKRDLRRVSANMHQICESCTDLAEEIAATS
jgi:ribosomal protein L37AE/L43A